MPWRVTSPMYERQRFVLDAEHAPCAFAELCRRYGISRKTGYKWLARYATAGLDGLRERSHRPQACPHATAPALIREILQLQSLGLGRTQTPPTSARYVSGGSSPHHPDAPPHSGTSRPHSAAPTIPASRASWPAPDTDH